MFRRIQQFLRSTDGNLATSFAMTLLPIAFITGVAVDYAEMERQRSRLQETADSTAFYAVKEMEKAGFGRIQAEAVAQDIKKTNFDIAGEVELSFDLATRKVIVELAKLYEPAFVHLFRSEPLPIRVLSEVTYSYVKGDAKCMLSLSGTGRGALSLNGNANINAPGCDVHVNSVSPDAVDLNGNGTRVTAKENCLVGGVSSGLDRISPAPNYDCDEIPDPFGDMEVAHYRSADCTHNNFRTNGNRRIDMQPGVYCGGIDLGSKVEADFAPGLYVIKDGKFKTTGQAELRGDGVTFLFTGDGIELDFSGGTTFNFTAMATGDYAGFIIFFDPEADVTGSSSFSGGSTTFFEGILYFGQHPVEVNGNGEVNAGSALSVLIADTITLNGNATLNLRVDEANTDIELPDILFDKDIAAYLSK